MKLLRETPLKGVVALTDALHSDAELIENKSLYKFILVECGEIVIEVDHVRVMLKAGEIISLTPLHHLVFVSVEGDYKALLFNGNFYCIYGHDSEVSCNGLLFHGSSDAMRLELTSALSTTLNTILSDIAVEFDNTDNLSEETLRIGLKRFIITCTRIARERLNVDGGNERGFDVVRQFFVLVDQNYKEKKQVADYADMLHRSPKTLTNMLATYNQPSPLKIIHRRIDAEAKRLLLYTSKSAGEIADILGFDDVASFSRFFKKMSGENIVSYRRRMADASR